ncbi:hypothetical protein RvY_15613 [Ramazzottius varieornatus]|uniref:heparosan-N-sulfate-glucuronate 5-epimerase n=1 Tax=Ramazzottius varieornatus TaxID=947166 RepID=A0A1D1W055_RAMVA|nr:hypothetical protein RvY_15613 [Ramazzottius varieornatus]
MRCRLPKMRFIWSFLAGGLFSLIVSFFFWSQHCITDLTHSLKLWGDNAPTTTRLCSPISPTGDTEALHKISCIINGDRRKPVDCRTNGADVFIPFSFIEGYFEITGKVEVDKRSANDGRFFNWQHSYAKLVFPKLPYEPDGIFMAFDNYNVEVRDRVQHISPSEGVPVSSQWSANNKGHFYPIQISQFGLSHYSKNISEEQPRRHVVADFEKSEDMAVGDECRVDRIEDDDRASIVLNFTAPEDVSFPGISLISIPDTGDPHILFSVKFLSKGSVILKLDVQDRQRQNYELVYTSSNESIRVENHRIFYGVGSTGEWTHLVRDVYIDLLKGLNLHVRGKKDKIKLNVTRMRILEITLHGRGLLDDVVVQSTAHSELFYLAAEWLVKYQDEEGGWPIWVKRRLGEAELAPGWYSAMAQGQAMSTLTRAYKRTGQMKYLEAAVRALDLFKKPSSEGGITAVFMDKYEWYEEYPTTPSSFVLNGFIYALLGLYDVSHVSTGGYRKRARQLFDEGVVSLKALLPLFDTGSGSSYDLRHFTLKGAPNLARWDYHATHVTQLLVMNSIHPDPMFAEFAERWSDYMKGKRSEHN